MQSIPARLVSFRGHFSDVAGRASAVALLRLAFDALGQARAEALERGRDVAGGELDFEQAVALRVPQRCVERGAQFGDGADVERLPALEQRRQPAILPLGDVVERAVLDEPLGAVAVVVEDDDDRVEAAAARRSPVSIPVMRNAPSPTRTSGRRLRFASCAPIEAGTAKPIEA